VRITGDETWVSFICIKTKEQSKAMNAHIFTKEAEKAQTNVRQKADFNCFLDKT
jgi:hypothetical protein